MVHLTEYYGSPSNGINVYHGSGSTTLVHKEVKNYKSIKLFLQVSLIKIQLIRLWYV